MASTPTSAAALVDTLSSDVVSIAFADSPYTAGAATTIACNAAGGAITVNLPAIATCYASRRVIIIAAIDNLTRGAGGQAVHNLNLMAGFPETQGLDAAPFTP